jgi:sterol 3beta-glucosyltransferase
MGREAAGLARRLPTLLAGSDLIVAGTSAIAGLLPIAGQLGVPVVQAYLFPFRPTRAFPSPLVPGLPFGRALNRLSFHATRQIFWQSTRVADVAVRQALGLAKGPLLGPFRALDRSPAPVLYGYSPLVLPRPDDWPRNVHVTGYWTLEPPGDWSPPDDLLAFLDAGEPPVYIGFGSMGSRDPQAAGRIALEALARTGQRGLLATGWGGLRADALPAHVHLTRAVPHSWLFPRLAAVVHHGGAGTTAAGLRAGIPAIVVPFMGDQPFWGSRVAALGVGPAPVPRRLLDAKRLAGAIAQAVSDPDMRERAAELGRRLRQEDGVATAVAHINRFMAAPLST